MKFILLIRSSWFSLNLQKRKISALAYGPYGGLDLLSGILLTFFSLMPRNTFSSLANPNKTSSVDIVGALL